jgi:hypothetical protein
MAKDKDSISGTQGRSHAAAFDFNDYESAADRPYRRACTDTHGHTPEQPLSTSSDDHAPILVHAGTRVTRPRTS